MKSTSRCVPRLKRTDSARRRLTPATRSAAKRCLSLTLALAFAACEPGRNDYASAVTAPVEKTANHASAAPAGTSLAESRVRVSWIADSAFTGEGSVWLLHVLGKNIYRTRDGGATWDSLAPNGIPPNSRIDFINSEQGWVVGASGDEGQIRRTKDGGVTWELIGRIKSDDPEWGFTSPVRIDFVDERRGWVVETFSVWRTEDGGRSWRRVLDFPDPPKSGQPASSFFLGAGRAWVCATDGRVYTTSNGGGTWDTASPGEADPPTVIHFVNEADGWLYADGTIYRTYEGGRVWQSVADLPAGVVLESIFFVDAKEGWAVGGKQAESPSDKRTPVDLAALKGVALHTKDGGRNWETVPVGKIGSRPRKVVFTAPQRGWILTDQEIYRTDNGGKTWVIALNPSIVSEIK